MQEPTLRKPEPPEAGNPSRQHAKGAGGSVREEAMKLIYKKGDVTDAVEPAIMHGCNAQGVMGSGVAAAIRTKFPNAYLEYRDAYGRFPGLVLGRIVGMATGGKVILNAITQDKFGPYRRQVNYEAVYLALEEANRIALRRSLHAIAMPRIGAGLGGGNWNIIAAMIEETSTEYQPVIYDYEP